jgi:nucleotide-binding universal stress UspA family protein
MAGVDGSDSGRLALRVAAAAAQRLDAAVVAVHIGRCPPWWFWLSALSSVAVALPPAEADDLEAAAFFDAAEILEDSGLTWHFHVRTGDPAVELERAAREAGAVLLVVGQRPHGRMRARLHHCPAAWLAHRPGLPVHIAVG